eukprot:3361986-Prymnesium_polylepis.1
MLKTSHSCFTLNREPRPHTPHRRIEVRARIRAVRRLPSADNMSLVFTLALLPCAASALGEATKWYGNVDAPAVGGGALTAIVAGPTNECPGIAVDPKGSHAWGGGLGSMNIQQFSYRLTVLYSMVQAGGVLTITFPPGTRMVVDQLIGADASIEATPSSYDPNRRDGPVAELADAEMSCEDATADADYIERGFKVGQGRWRSEWGEFDPKGEKALGMNVARAKAAQVCGRSFSKTALQLGSDRVVIRLGARAWDQAAMLATPADARARLEGRRALAASFDEDEDSQDDTYDEGDTYDDEGDTYDDERPHKKKVPKKKGPPTTSLELQGRRALDRQSGSLQELSIKCERPEDYEKRMHTSPPP